MSCVGVLTLVLLVSYGSADAAKFVDPYTPGPYAVEEYIVTPDIDGCPLHSTIYFPVTTGKVTPIMFVGGVSGYVLSEFYANYLAELAAHGYIVIGIDPFYPLPPSDPRMRGQGRGKDYFWGEGERRQSVGNKTTSETYFKQCEWLRENINNRTEAVPDWSKSAFMCQSAGCDDTLDIINRSRSYVQAAIFIDPVAVSSVEMKPFPSKVTALISMSELSESFPDCCIPGLGWKRIYDLMTCVKVRMEPKEFGHCDLMVPYLWKLCHETKICKTTDDTRLAEYRQFTAGVSAAFIQWTVYGDKSMMKYVTDQSSMPLPLVDLVYNTTCAP